MPDEGVKCMVEDVDGTVLAGTINGLLRYDPETDSMTVPYPELRNELCISLYRDSRDRIWLGTFYHGAFCIDNGKIRHYTFPETGSAELSYYVETPNLNCVRAFYEDYLGNFWISVYGGVGRFDTEKGTIDMLRDSHPEVTRFMIVRDICDHGDGLLLFSGDNGRFLYSPSEDRVETDMHSVRCYTQSNQAVLDDRGLLWIATSDGLFISDRTSGSVYTVGVSSGLPNDNVISLAVDNMNNIWAATFNSISRIKAIRNDSGYSFSVSNFTDTIPQREVMQKHYFYDNGILNLFLINPESKLLENLVAIYLLRNYGNNLYYYNRNVEVDFYVPSASLAIQVSYQMINQETREREISALVKLHAFKPLQRSLIITYNEENSLTIGNQTIEIVPIWKWMLENDSL